MRTRVLLLRGTGESQAHPERNLLWAVVRQLPESWSREEVTYPASISFANQNRNLFGVSGDRSVLLGVEQLRATLRNAHPDDRFVVLGYSLGALVGTKFLESLEPVLRSKVLAAGFVANPLRPKGLSAGRGDVGGFGLVDSVELPWLERRWELARPDDVVTAARADSLFRPWAEEVLAFSVADPAPAVQKFFWDTLLGKNQLPVAALFDGRFEQAAKDARGYLSTAHTLGYGLRQWNYWGLQLSATDWLAKKLRQTLFAY
ncbi:lysin B [Gordonia phage Ghobes]|uniref:Lysin B n=1 Tax=Gordonia phage Ghobes TaxID=1887647 RepID=A0A1B3B071_9CAUD|nr:endolysin [Gordonia phage Ghobes]AOE44392.1 lysin B [Gordonia phage Ghobes]